APPGPTPQPYLVPVRPACSRSAQSKGVSPSTSRSRVVPFTLSFAYAASLSGLRGGGLGFAPQDLAHVGLRQLLPDIDDLRAFVAGEVRLAVRDHLLLGEVG